MKRIWLMMLGAGAFFTIADVPHADDGDNACEIVAQAIAGSVVTGAHMPPAMSIPQQENDTAVGRKAPPPPPPPPAGEGAVEVYEYLGCSKDMLAQAIVAAKSHRNQNKPTIVNQ